MILKNTVILIACLTTFFIGDHTTDRGIERKIEKRVHKVFKRSDCSLKPLSKLPLGFYEPVGELYNQFEIITPTDEKIGYVLHGMTHVCYFGGCSVYTDQSKNVNREEVKYIIYFSPTQEIKFIEIIDFESNYGYEISAKWWLKQFYNKRPGSFVLGDDIDGISGATVSCEQFVNTLNQLATPN